ncbi:hypothetical protein SAMN05444266_101634 [Chitinophaga jiangningensis]|uniref:Uncharacterized protein n=1 Tax=Chitinophaga jiangningensis TaxID=1419482 RepID=A0A1M6WI30_9BACT|nr:hypothetical protein [Chitinophaga jiangningensis]SHK93348.1 hypothetical protein SAMN05444266_101634 [Chitinophaga jiangningensis]
MKTIITALAMFFTLAAFGQETSTYERILSEKLFPDVATRTTEYLNPIYGERSTYYCLDQFFSQRGAYVRTNFTFLYKKALEKKAKAVGATGKFIFLQPSGARSKHGKKVVTVKVYQGFWRDGKFVSEELKRLIFYYGEDATDEKGLEFTFTNMQAEIAPSGIIAGK